MLFTELKRQFSSELAQAVKQNEWARIRDKWIVRATQSLSKCKEIGREQRLPVFKSLSFVNCKARAFIGIRLQAGYPLEQTEGQGPNWVENESSSSESPLTTRSLDALTKRT